MQNSELPSCNGVAEYIAALKNSEKLGAQITCHTELPARAPRFAATARPWSRAISNLLEGLSIRNLYSHQALALDALRAGKHVAVSTPTASGKTLIYALSALERCLHDPEAHSLFLFPLKALAQDQLASFLTMTGFWPESGRPRAEIYDGDTSPHFRRKIRAQPPQILMTNPEMLHLALLPHHHLWSSLLAGLSLVVVDEMHTYRGLLGSHMALVFRRLLRLASLYGASPLFVFCSATVGNPEELANLLTGLRPVPVLESGAPQGKRHYIFINPQESPASTAIKLIKAALPRKLRCIVYCRSRRMTELISLWASEQSGEYSSRISSYRAGFLPEERREIEKRMSSGELLAVISTSALELGIDIGSLDLCILVGYPGTVMSTLQRGGRVGRGRRESAVLLIAGEDALDQYIVRHAEDFFSRPPEKAALNPENPVILERHLECAAAEHPLRPGRDPDAAWLTPAMLDKISLLEKSGLLLRSADGEALLAARKRPQRHISLRGSGHTVSIESPGGELIGSVDGVRALREVHPGAIYIHLGRHFEITELDLPAGRALARAFRPSWYTRARGHKNTEILSLDGSSVLAGLVIQRGRLRITEYVTGYEKRAIKNGQLLEARPLDFPPLIFETEGLWFQISAAAQNAMEEARMHFMGSVHALEHAAIGILPLQILADRDDFGGISTPMHPQTGRATVFIYDGIPGGAGLSHAAFQQSSELFERTRQVIAECPCELGCPSCVHSPKCGSGNRPIDKEGALRLLEHVLADTSGNRNEAAAILNSPLSGLETSPSFSAWTEIPEKSDKPFFPGPCPEEAEKIASPPVCSREKSPVPDFVVLDVETRLSAAEVGGWHRAGRMGVSVAVVYEAGADAFRSYTQEKIPELVRRLASAPLVIGFNLLRFDYAVLAPHVPDFDFRALPTLDLLLKIQEQLSYRLSLDNLARATLNSRKSADGLTALQWWKEGKVAEIEEYCRRDVAITRDLYLYGRASGYLLFTDKSGKKVRVRADW
jgi:DEAD/DEAH box helicase domain-containing protein